MKNTFTQAQQNVKQGIVSVSNLIKFIENDRQIFDECFQTQEDLVFDLDGLFEQLCAFYEYNGTSVVECREVFEKRVQEFYDSRQPIIRQLY